MEKEGLGMEKQGKVEQKELLGPWGHGDSGAQPSPREPAWNWLHPGLVAESMDV